MRIIYERPDRIAQQKTLFELFLLCFFLVRCTINTIAVKNRDSRKIQTVSRASHDSLYRYGYNILSISEENSWPLSPPRLHKLFDLYIEFSSSVSPTKYIYLCYQSSNNTSRNCVITLLHLLIFHPSSLAHTQKSNSYPIQIRPKSCYWPLIEETLPYRSVNQLQYKRRMAQEINNHT